MRTFLMTLLAVLALPTPLFAQDACPCVPLTHVWMVKTCPDWNLVSAELAVANGDPQVIAIPIGMNDARWLIVRRMVSGAAIENPNEPFRVQQFIDVVAKTLGKADE